jgi:pimeloyl-ACP methyl ester carboxylesterase
MRERMVSLRGLEFCLCEWGPEDGPVVVILHGWLDQGAAWNRVARELASKGLYVLAPDQRGHGRSSHTPSGTTYHFPEYLADLDALLTQLEIGEFVLVGHSMGGTVASLYAGLRPDRVGRLILVEGIGPPSEDSEGAVDRLSTWLTHQDRPWDQKPMKDLDSAARRLRRFNPGLPPAEARFLADRTTVLRDGALYWTWDPLHRSRSATSYSLTRHLACLARIRAEVLFVCGDQSWYMGIPDLDERLSAIPRLSRRVELHAGHALHIDAPVALAEIIRESVLRVGD